MINKSTKRTGNKDAIPEPVAQDIVHGQCSSDIFRRIGSHRWGESGHIRYRTHLALELEFTQEERRVCSVLRLCVSVGHIWRAVLINTLCVRRRGGGAWERVVVRERVFELRRNEGSKESAVECGCVGRIGSNTFKSVGYLLYQRKSFLLVVQKRLEFRTNELKIRKY